MAEAQINATFGGPIDIHVTIVKEEPFNVTIGEPVDISVIIEGQIGCKGDPGGDMSLLVPYEITDLDIFGSPQYFGYVDKDGKWYIMELTGIAARYIKGNDHYEDAWNIREELNYDYFNNIF